MNIKNFTPIVKIYTATALLIAAVFSPLSFSAVPLVLLVWYLYEWIWPVSAMIDLLTQYFVYFAIAIIFSGIISPFLAFLPALPVLLAITDSLEKAAVRAQWQPSPHPMSLTLTSITTLILVGGVAIAALIVTNLSLVLACALLLLYLLALGYFVVRNFRGKPVTADHLQMRIVAGKEEQTRITVHPQTRLGSLLWVESTQSWIKVMDNRLSLKSPEAAFEIKLTPGLSGPTVIKLNAYAADRWGLWQKRFEIEPVKLYVIPRARYASWLAQKYLSGTGPGSLPLLSSLGSIKPLQGLRQGVEYYGNRQYQAGDSLKNIDWKHSSKYNELITREYTEFHGQTAVILINLDTGNAEEADKLAYNLIVTALTLGQENIPAALAVYDREKVVLTTASLFQNQLILRALQIAKAITITANPRRYLNPPDINKLRANIRRLNQVGSPSAGTLAEILQLEYKNLHRNGKQHPCTQALTEVVSRLTGTSSIVVLSARNHDAEALAINSFLQSQKGHTVIEIN